MRTISWILLLITCGFIGCRSMRTITEFKTDQPLRTPHNKILVVAITHNDSTRRIVEENFVAQLRSIGYHPESSLSLFGSKGLSGIGMEGTYLKLCDEGVDAILTIVKLDKKQIRHQKIRSGSNYLNSHYLYRIWDYRLINENDKPEDPVYETILFDIPQMAPHFVGRTIIPPASDTWFNPGFADQIIRKMQARQILLRNLEAVQRAF